MLLPAGLSHIIETRKVLDLKVDLKPSYLLLPKSGFYSNTSDLIIVDFGSLQVQFFFLLRSFLLKSFIRVAESNLCVSLCSLTVWNRVHETHLHPPSPLWRRSWTEPMRDSAWSCDESRCSTLNQVHNYATTTAEAAVVGSCSFCSEVFTRQGKKFLLFMPVFLFCSHVQVRHGRWPVCMVHQSNTSYSQWTSQFSWRSAWWRRTPACPGTCVDR